MTGVSYSQRQSRPIDTGHGEWSTASRAQFCYAVTSFVLLNHSPACGSRGRGSRGTSLCHTTSEDISLIPQKQEKDLASEVAKKSLFHLRSSVRIAQYTNLGLATVVVLAHY